MERKAVGLFGGSFNPITEGHLSVAKGCLRYFDEVWISPCHRSLSAKDLIDGEHRLAMCKLVADEPRIRILDTEIRRGLALHPYEFWKEVVAAHPDCDFSFIMGTDVANTVERWDHYPQILQEVKFAIIPRKGHPIRPNIQWLPPHRILDVEAPSCSSSEWRESHSRDPEHFGFIDGRVADYIRKNGL